MHKLLALTGAAAVALAGCQQGETTAGNTGADAAKPAAAPSGTLAEVLPAGSTRFRQAIEAAGLQATLRGPGPYTVLVPEDGAFAKLPAATQQQLMSPQAKPQLTTVLTYHILPGTILTADLDKAIANGQGKAVLATMAGKTLTATRQGDRIVLTDQAGQRAAITGEERPAGNGVIHAVDGVLLPMRDLVRPS